MLVLLASTQGVSTALIAAAAFVLYMNFENHVIQPTIVGRSVDLTPPTTMVAAFVGAAIAGIPGALVATPLVGAAKAIYLEARGTGGGLGSPNRWASSGGSGRRLRRGRSDHADKRRVATLPHPAQIAQSVEQRTRNA